MKLLLTGAFSYSEEMLSLLRGLGCELLFHRDEREKIPFDVSDVEAVVCNGLFLYNDISLFKGLKFIQTTSAGLDRIPLDFVKEHEILLCNARGVYSIPMAEFALAGTLALYKRLPFFYENQKKHLWHKEYSLEELSSKQVLVVGCGSVGTECAKRYAAFCKSVAGADLVCPKSEYYSSFYPMPELGDALHRADIVVLTLPLTNETRGLFDSEMFACFKRGSVLVNLARGAVVNEADLLSALKSGQVGGAVLDVFESEPLSPDSELWDMRNVIVTPHNCYASPENNGRLFDVIYSNIKQYTEG
ncbi:MAG: hydroxyacid dehydrogenase [Clostridia bacterium]|nr:hydroxyacid dehydrogenase [Clostridia bacterium]